MKTEDEIEFWAQMADAARALGYYRDELRSLRNYYKLCCFMLMGHEEPTELFGQAA